MDFRKFESDIRTILITLIGLLVCVHAYGLSHDKCIEFDIEEISNNGNTLPPTVTTGTPTGISNTAATLTGSVNANNSPTTVTFEYGLSTSYGTTVVADQSPVTGSSNTTVSAMIMGLTPNTTYHYRVIGTNVNGTVTGSDQTFSTAGPPTVGTNPATNVTGTGATLNGIVNAKNSSTTVTFEYGTTTSYGTTVTADQSPVTGNASILVSSTISGLVPGTVYHFRAVGTNAYGTDYGADFTFTTIVGPIVSTNAPSGIGTTGATMNGTVNANSSSTNVTFEYGTTTSYGNAVTADQSPVTGNTNMPVSKTVSSLSSGTTYHYRVAGTNMNGTTYGGNMTFTTLSTGPPTATTNAATGISTSGATLNGTVNANNSSTTVTFEYGLTTSYGTTVTADQSPVTGSTNTSVSSSISGLASNTTYHYRVTGTNTNGTTNGADMTFTTMPANPPTVTTNAVTGIGTTGATLNGTVNANNSSTTVTFEYGTTTSYGTTVTADQSPVTGNTNTPVTSSISGLASNTTFHYRVVGTNVNGTSNGADMTFTTSPPTVVVTEPADGIGVTTATLNGSVTAYGISSAVFFQYGTSPSYGTTVQATQSPVSSNSPTPVDASISGLTENTTYHYRAVGMNVNGTAYGGDMTFTTNLPPVVSTGTATNVGSTFATLNGTVNPNGNLTTVIFQYGTTPSYGTTVSADLSPVFGTVSIPVSTTIRGLTPNTRYHYRAVGVVEPDVTITYPGDDGELVSGPVTIEATVSGHDPCSCNDIRNCDINGVLYFHDTLTVTAEGLSGLTITVAPSPTDVYVSVPCFGGGSVPTLISPGTIIPEIIPGSGVYQIEFWRPSGVLPTLSLIESGTTTVLPSSTFEPICLQENCQLDIIPTLSEWGMIILGLVLLILSVTGVRQISRSEETIFPH